MLGLRGMVTFGLEFARLFAARGLGALAAPTGHCGDRSFAPTRYLKKMNNHETIKH